MTTLFGILTIVFGGLLVLVVVFYFEARRGLKSAEEESSQLRHQSEEKIKEIRQQAKKALARYKGIADLEEFKANLQIKVDKARKLLPKFQNLAEMEQHKLQLSEIIEQLIETETHSREQLIEAETQSRVQIAEQASTLENLVSQTKAVEETLEMQSFGFYRPNYDFDDSEHYKIKLDSVRDDQKSLTRLNGTTHCDADWSVEGSAAKGRKMIKEHSKLMQRAFNGECDAAVGKVKYNNVTNLENRINKSFDAINKLGESKKLWITREYLKLKLQELYLVHEHREKVQEEREEQRRIKEEMREEEKVAKEIEKVKKEAEKEEAEKTMALDKFRQELAESHGKQTDRLKSIVDKLETELKDALERKAKAIARAQLTRSGHVYVLSNIGSFGEGVYKIGLTRRLEPLVRVKELGDASVPFLFDVHAMIYSEDAPKLEKALHAHFDSRRLNAVNTRKEFFRVTLDEIREAVQDNFGEITFVTSAEAEEYSKTLALREDMVMTEKHEVVL